MQDTRDFGFIFWLHLAVIIVVWSSPFWLPWKLVLLGIGFYYFQLRIIGGCILTRWQFRSTTQEVTFYSHALEKVGFRFSRQKLSFFVDYIIPWSLFVVALTWQVILKQPSI